MYSEHKTVDEHVMQIVEEGKPYSTTGVTSLEFTCSCGEHKSWTKADNPKYRLALRAAEDYGNEHAGGLDKRPWVP